MKTVWLASTADVLSYMDIDLSTDLAHLPELIGPLLAGRADVAFGSRHLPGSRVTRGWKRSLLSRGYNRLVRAVLGLPVRDAQCGFKALSRAAARALLPQVRDPGFFFDTELLARAHRGGWRLLELPCAGWTTPTAGCGCCPPSGPTCVASGACGVSGGIRGNRPRD